MLQMLFCLVLEQSVNQRNQNGKGSMRSRGRTVV